MVYIHCRGVGSSRSIHKIGLSLAVEVWENSSFTFLLTSYFLNSGLVKTECYVCMLTYATFALNMELPVAMECNTFRFTIAS
jgi:hypothetical protein